MLNGIAPQQVVGNLTYLLKEYPVSNLYDENSNANVGVVLSLDDKDKTSLQDIQKPKNQRNTKSTNSIWNNLQAKVILP